MNDLIAELDAIPREQITGAIARLTLRARETDPTYSQEKADKRSLDEYTAVLGLMQDTGQSIWVINGAYLLAATVLVTAIFNGVVEEHNRPLLVGGALAGFLICSLWFMSFQRNYSFYVLRIEYAKRLERRLGFWLLRMGAAMGDDEASGLELDDSDDFKTRVETFERQQRENNASRKRFPLNLLDVGFNSIQWLTTCLILIFALGFAVLFGMEFSALHL